MNIVLPFIPRGGHEHVLSVKMAPCFLRPELCFGLFRLLLSLLSPNKDGIVQHDKQQRTYNFMVWNYGFLFTFYIYSSKCFPIYLSHRFYLMQLQSLNW